jgi:hypothetical protein
VAGFPCASDGLSCTWDSCDGAGLCRHDLFAGCLIDGACAAAGATDPGNDCQECNPALATAAYSAKAKGVSCADDGDERTADVCDGAGACAHPTKGQCLIAGRLYDAGTTNPENVCQSCEPASTASAWTNRGAGFPCPSDGLACTSDVCDGAGACGHLLFTGCLVGGECAAAGATDPADECQACDPARSTDAYVARARGVLCGDDGDDRTADFCDGQGACVHELKGAVQHRRRGLRGRRRQPRQRLRVLRPDLLGRRLDQPHRRLPLPSDGLTCTSDVCDGAGACTHPLFTGCLVDGACIGSGSLDPANGCLACDPRGPPRLQPGAARPGLRRRRRRHHARRLRRRRRLRPPAARPVHHRRGGVRRRRREPENPCQSCDPAASASAWTSRVPGFPCTSDGLACTRDACDGSGACEHDSSPAA